MDGWINGWLIGGRSVEHTINLSSWSICWWTSPCVLTALHSVRIYTTVFYGFCTGMSTSKYGGQFNFDPDHPNAIYNWNKSFSKLSPRPRLVNRFSLWTRTLQSSWNVMEHGDTREGKWRGNWRMEWVASTLHTTSEHGVSSITTADAHTSAASSRLWRLRRFKWTRPFHRKTKSGSCACAITFQTQYTYHNLLSITVKPSLLHECSGNSRAVRRISRSNVDRKTAFVNLCFTWNLNRKYLYKIQKL